MKAYLDLAYWQAVLRNPTALVGLCVDLAPAWAVLVWGWGAAPLILLYWLENLVIGAMTVCRIAICVVGRSGPKGVFEGAFLIGFFIFHYGLFCMVHGAFLLMFLTGDEHWMSGAELTPMLLGIIKGAISIGRHMDWMLGLLTGWHVFALLDEFILRGRFRTVAPKEVMFEPYGRIILLHIAIFVIGGAVQAMGDPAPAVLAMILARTFWGLSQNMRSSRPAKLAAAGAAS